MQSEDEEVIEGVVIRCAQSLEQSLNVACRTGDAGAIASLLPVLAKPPPPTALLEAVAWSRVEATKVLLGMGASVTAKGSVMTPGGSGVSNDDTRDINAIDLARMMVMAGHRPRRAQMCLQLVQNEAQWEPAAEDDFLRPEQERKRTMGVSMGAGARRGISKRQHRLPERFVAEPSARPSADAVESVLISLAGCRRKGPSGAASAPKPAPAPPMATVADASILADVFDDPDEPLPVPVRRTLTSLAEAATFVHHSQQPAIDMAVYPTAAYNDGAFPPALDLDCGVAQQPMPNAASRQTSVGSHPSNVMSSTRSSEDAAAIQHELAELRRTVEEQGRAMAAQNRLLEEQQQLLRQWMASQRAAAAAMLDVVAGSSVDGA